MPSGASYAAGPEALLVGLARLGDEDAFAELVRRRHAAVRLLLRRLAGDRELADELALRAFLEVWRTLPGLRDPGLLGGRIEGAALAAWRRRFRRILRAAAPEADGSTVAEDATVGAAELDRALDQLAPRERACVVLAYQAGLNAAGIARWTGLSPAAAERALRRGEGFLLERLAPALTRIASGRRP